MRGGAAVPGATVRVTEIQTGDTRSGTTNEARRLSHDFRLCRPASYRVDITKAGFKSFEANSVSVRQGDAVRVDAQLQVGAQSDKVEVTADVAVLQADRADVHTTISAENFIDLPQATRTYEGMVQMVPGISPPGGNLLGGNNNPSKTMEFEGNGGGFYSVDVRIEGISAQNGWGSGATSSFAPSVEAIASMNVVTGSPDAEWAAGANLVLGATEKHPVSTVLRSGNIDNKFEADSCCSAGIQTSASRR